MELNRATNRMYMLSYTFNKSTTANPLCIRFNQSCKTNLNHFLTSSPDLQYRIISGNKQNVFSTQVLARIEMWHNIIPSIVPYSKDERGSSVAPSLRSRSHKPWWWDRQCIKRKADGIKRRYKVVFSARKRNKTKPKYSSDRTETQYKEHYSTSTHWSLWARVER